jgi:hypothetical protein
VLRELAGIFLETSRDTDILGRFDESSFLFFLPNTPKEGARSCAARGRDGAARGLVDLVGDKLVISCGISATPHATCAGARICSRATQGLLRSAARGRRSGRSCLRVRLLLSKCGARAAAWAPDEIPARLRAPCRALAPRARLLEGGDGARRSRCSPIRFRRRSSARELAAEAESRLASRGTARARRSRNCSRACARDARRGGAPALVRRRRAARARLRAVARSAESVP